MKGTLLKRIQVLRRERFHLEVPASDKFIFQLQSQLQLQLSQETASRIFTEFVKSPAALCFTGKAPSLGYECIRLCLSQVDALRHMTKYSYHWQQTARHYFYTLCTATESNQPADLYSELRCKNDPFTVIGRWEVQHRGGAGKDTGHVSDWELMP